MKHEIQEELIKVGGKIIKAIKTEVDGKELEEPEEAKDEKKSEERQSMKEFMETYIENHLEGKTACL